MSAPEQTIIDQIVSWLREIHTDTGYSTDFGLLVLGEEGEKDENPNDRIILRDTGVEYIEPEQDERSEAWVLTLEIEALFAVVDPGLNARFTAREILHDIRRALRRSSFDSDWPAGLVSLTPVSWEIVERDEGSSYQIGNVIYECKFADMADQLTPP